MNQSELRPVYIDLRRLLLHSSKIISLYHKTGLSPPVTLCTDRSKAILLWWFFLFYVLVFKKIIVLLAPYVCFHSFS